MCAVNTCERFRENQKDDKVSSKRTSEGGIYNQCIDQDSLNILLSLTQFRQVSS